MLGIASSVLSFIVVLAIVTTGLSRELSTWALALATNEYLALLLFLAAVGIVESVVTLPLGFYSSYIIEHRYGLSNQTLGRWAWERLKALLVAAPLMAIVAVVLFYCLKTYGMGWWLPVAIVLTMFSIILARIVPTYIMPLFYKFTPIENGSLKERITALCRNAGVRIEGIFSFDMSKNTKKANAGFTGIGKAKRIILGDTLLKEFTEEEIETVFAHELGHYKHKHLLIGMGVGVLSTFVGLYITARLYAVSLSWFGFSSITDIAALPVLGLWLSIFGLVTSPLGNMLSRKHEREADRYAVQTTGKKMAFVSALRKLAETNLADPEPHPVVEFLFYSHPSIARRIAMVEAINGR
jgi:STE24 endopeptidase